MRPRDMVCRPHQSSFFRIAPSIFGLVPASWRPCRTAMSGASIAPVRYRKGIGQSLCNIGPYRWGQLPVAKVTERDLPSPRFGEDTRIIQGIFSTVFGIAAACTVTVPGSATAQDQWPSGPIQIVVPYGAGGHTDFHARVQPKCLEPFLGVAMPVINVTGAGGIDRRPTGKGSRCGWSDRVAVPHRDDGEHRLGPDAFLGAMLNLQAFQAGSRAAFSSSRPMLPGRA